MFPLPYWSAGKWSFKTILLKKVDFSPVDAMQEEKRYSFTHYLHHWCKGGVKFTQADYKLYINYQLDALIII